MEHIVLVIMLLSLLSLSLMQVNCDELADNNRAIYEKAGHSSYIKKNKLRSKGSAEAIDRGLLKKRGRLKDVIPDDLYTKLKPLASPEYKVSIRQSSAKRNTKIDPYAQKWRPDTSNEPRERGALKYKRKPHNPINRPNVFADLQLLPPPASTTFVSSKQTEETKIDLSFITNLFTTTQIAHGPISVIEAKNKCSLSFDNRRFYTDEDPLRQPPVLYSFPGAGNTWTRLLIEYATGIYTGSVYTDRLLISTLPGEAVCSRRVSLIKIHPHTHGYKTGRTPIGLGTYFKTQDNKCAKGAIKGFSQAVFLYQRRMSKSHIKGITRRQFNIANWQGNAASLSYQYRDMWFHYNQMIADFGHQNILFLSYENLRNSSRGIDELRKLAQFIHLPANAERLHCAFLLAESKGIHRDVKNSTLMMTKDEVYTKALACEMWQLFGSWAATVGYASYGDYNCSSYSPIKHVLVYHNGNLVNGQKLETGIERRKPRAKYRYNITSKQVTPSGLATYVHQSNKLESAPLLGR